MDWIWFAALALLISITAWFLLFLARVRWLTSRPGIFECALATPPLWKPRDGWCMYSGGDLLWFPLASVTRQPKYRWKRHHFDIRSARSGRSARTNAVLRVLEVSSAGQVFQLYMHEGSAAGVRSWSESAPPAWETSTGISSPID